MTSTYCSAISEATLADPLTRELPTLHVIRAALHVASLIDRRGSRVDDARESYWRHATGGVFPPPDLRMGERLLVECGLVDERDGVLHPTDILETLLAGTFEDAAVTIVLHVLVAGADPQAAPTIEQSDLTSIIDDPDRRERLLLALGQKWDDAHHRLIGEIGEDLVVESAKAELDALGHPDLARAVRRVSIDSDQLGYDVTAPRIGGPSRLLEVKSTTGVGDPATIHLSRNELDTGARFVSWSLVLCRVHDTFERTGEVVGWCTASDLMPLVPHDGERSRWEVTAVELASSLLHPGLPRPTH